MNRSLKYILILIVYLSAGWALGYYLSHPDIVTSALVQKLLNPLGVTLAAETYSLSSQFFFAVFGLIALLVEWTMLALIFFSDWVLAQLHIL